MRPLALPWIQRLAAIAMLCAAAPGAQSAGTASATASTTAKTTGSTNANSNANASPPQAAIPAPVDRITWLMPQIDAEVDPAKRLALIRQAEMLMEEELVKEKKRATG